MIDRVKLEVTLDRIGSLIVQGDFREVERLTKGVRLSSEEMKSAIASYGRRLVFPPSGHFQPRSIVEVEGEGGPPRWSVYVDLWTAEEGRSDLTLEVTLADTRGDTYEIEIDDIHVL
jgi:hypothetical protein